MRPPQTSRCRRALTALLAAGALVVTATATVLLSEPAGQATASGTESEILGVWVEGMGNGHGRGMGQWGAYGRALEGQTWTEILDTYYGGTVPGTATAADHVPAADGQMTVRLVSLDGFAVTGVISESTPVRWNDQTARSMYAQHLGGSNYEIFASDVRACPAATFPTLPAGPLTIDTPVTATDTARAAQVTAVQRFLTVFGHNPGPIDGMFGSMTAAAVQRFQTASGLSATGVWGSAEAAAGQNAMMAADDEAGWVSLGTVDVNAGPIVFGVDVDESSAAGNEVLGVCNRAGTVTHYRGEILALRDTGGALRTVNRVGIENYLRGVLPREMPATWGSAGGGAGMHALRAQAVAARSYALSQDRYTAGGSYAKTCDTTACQAYGGAAQRPGPFFAAQIIEHVNTDQAIADTAGVVRRFPDGRIVSTEYSASNGLRTAGGVFPAVDDPFDAQNANPLHVWTRFVSAASLRSRYGLSNITAATVEPDPTRLSAGFEGAWANRVRLNSSTTVSSWDFRGHFGFPSPSFTLTPVTRDAVMGQSLAVIGDSILEGVTAPGGPLPTVFNGVFSPASYDAVSSRRTSGAVNGITDGVAAARAVPVGTDVVLVHLGYNDPSGFATRIDAVMGALRERHVGAVIWVNLSERATGRGFTNVNAALRDATARHPELSILDWNAHSTGAARGRWFGSDNVHLSPTGRAEFVRFLRSALIGPERGAQSLFGVPASLAGSDRITTAIAVAQAAHAPLGEFDPSRPAAQSAVLVASTSFADALAAGPLAVAVGGPLLLTAPGALDARVASTLTALVPPGSMVYLVGGLAVLSAEVEDAVAAAGFQPQRLAGSNRYATAVRVAEQGIAAPSAIFLATGRNFADALAAGTVAARQGAVVLLTDDERIPAVVADYLAARPGVPVITVGGPADRAYPDASRSFVGANRFATATALAEAYPPVNGVVGAANGERFPDALAATPYLARQGGVLLLVRTDAVTDPTRDFLRTRPGLDRVQVFGGSAVVSGTARAALSAALRG